MGPNAPQPPLAHGPAMQGSHNLAAGHPPVPCPCCAATMPEASFVLWGKQAVFVTASCPGCGRRSRCPPDRMELWTGKWSHSAPERAWIHGRHARAGPTNAPKCRYGLALAVSRCGERAPKPRRSCRGSAQVRRSSCAVGGASAGTVRVRACRPGTGCTGRTRPAGWLGRTRLVAGRPWVTSGSRPPGRTRTDVRCAPVRPYRPRQPRSHARQELCLCGSAGPGSRQQGHEVAICVPQSLLAPA